MSDKMLTVNDKDMIRMAFRALDKEGKGTIDCAIFRHLMTHIGKNCWKKIIVSLCLGDKLPEQFVDELIDKADKNGDGALNYEEFVKMLTSE